MIAKESSDEVFEREGEKFGRYLEELEVVEFDVKLMYWLKWFLRFLPAGHPIVKINYDREKRIWITMSSDHLKKFLSLSKLFHQLNSIKRDGISLWDFFCRDCVLKADSVRFHRLRLGDVKHTEITFSMRKFPEFIWLLRHLMEYLQAHLHLKF
eukprot:TRINITY_DN20495_c0_g1_i1.p1 TRINITY_DN20495_c0_g1~~TRINITY_DN20495_c0_g1_i1.p1  ORF type:complete len:154 (-),score=26.68 TRINITY_DN20495_c0_g1_i1:71-532(-)